STRQDATYRFEVEFHGFVFEQPAPAFHESHESVFIVKCSLAHHRPNNRIQPGTIAPARQHSNLHCLLLIGFCGTSMSLPWGGIYSALLFCCNGQECN